MTDLAELALASGAMQLGEAPGENFIFSREELARFAEAVRGDGVQEIPPLPY